MSDSKIEEIDPDLPPTPSRMEMHEMLSDQRRVRIFLRFRMMSVVRVSIPLSLFTLHFYENTERFAITILRIVFLSFFMISMVSGFDLGFLLENVVRTVTE